MLILTPRGSDDQSTMLVPPGPLGSSYTPTRTAQRVAASEDRHSSSEVALALPLVRSRCRDGLGPLLTKALTRARLGFQDAARSCSRSPCSSLHGHRAA